MFKKVFLVLLCFITCSAAMAATENNTTLIKGFQNLESIQKLSVLNRLSAIADNDDVIFSKIWPEEYFSNSNNFSYIYLTKNDNQSLDVIKFNYIPAGTDCYSKENPEFCIPKLNPVMEHYVFNQRLIAENTPDFISQPTQKEVLEILMKDNQYFDTMKVKSIKSEIPHEIYRKCDFDHDFLKSCQVFNKDTDELISSEELIMKDDLTGFEDEPLNKALKYVKYNKDGNKIEEYIYSSGKHIFYDENGKVSLFEQYNGSKFKYYNSSAPDLYIDVDFQKDENGHLIAEYHYDSNHRLLRKYSANYEGKNISKIIVEDIVNNAKWEILPIRISNLKEQLFAIRF